MLLPFNLRPSLVKTKGRFDRRTQLLQTPGLSICLLPSFGAFTGLAVAEALKRLHNLEAAHIFLSGASAPYVSSSGPPHTRPRLSIITALTSKV